MQEAIKEGVHIPQRTTRDQHSTLSNVMRSGRGTSLRCWFDISIDSHEGEIGVELTPGRHTRSVLRLSAYSGSMSVKSLFPEEGNIIGTNRSRFL